MINTNLQYNMSSWTSIVSSNLFSKILYLNYAYKYTNVPNTITFTIWLLK